MLFEVTKAPDGDSPQFVRDAWVGVQFRALQGAPITMPTRAASAQRTGNGAGRGAKPEITKRRGYPVKAREVLGLLALRNTEAAQWYIQNVPQMLDREQVFMFDETCCRAITAVTAPPVSAPDDAKNNR